MAPPESTAIILCGHDPLTTFFDIPFGSRLVQYPGTDGVHYSAMTDAYRIAVTRNATDTLRLIERSLRDERISDEEWTAGIRDFEEFLVENPNASCDPRRPSRPARKPFIEDIFLAPDGTLWVEVIRSAGNRLEVFDPEGRLLGSLPAPSRKEGSVPAFGAGHLVTVRRDSLDLDHVDVWRIDRAGRGTRGAIIDRLESATLVRQPQRHMQVVGCTHMVERVEAHRPERHFGRQVPPFGPVDGAKIQRVDESVVLAEVQ